eukprot:5445580-Amphidinium_carterae.1
MLKLASTPWTTTTKTQMNVTGSCGYDPDAIADGALPVRSVSCVRATYGCVRILPLPGQQPSNDRAKANNTNP